MAKKISKTSARRATKTTARGAAKKSARKTAAVKMPRVLLDEAKVSIVKDYPAREGTAAYKMWTALKGCKTVQAARAKLEKVESRDGHTAMMLRLWNKKGFVKIA